MICGCVVGVLLMVGLILGFIRVCLFWYLSLLFVFGDLCLGMCGLVRLV